MPTSKAPLIFFSNLVFISVSLSIMADFPPG
jgi:hypothetical protein